MAQCPCLEQEPRSGRLPARTDCLAQSGRAIPVHVRMTGARAVGARTRGPGLGGLARASLQPCVPGASMAAAPGPAPPHCKKSRDTAET